MQQRTTDAVEPTQVRSQTPCHRTTIRLDEVDTDRLTRMLGHEFPDPRVQIASAFNTDISEISDELLDRINAVTNHVEALGLFGVLRRHYYGENDINAVVRCVACFCRKPAPEPATASAPMVH